MMEAFVGIDVAFAKRKRLPVCVCSWQAGRLVPLPLRQGGEPKPPRGEGNVKALDDRVVSDFASATMEYLLAVQKKYAVRIKRIAIDAPSAAKRAGSKRRSAEDALDKKRISCITTPSQEEFDIIRKKARAHLERDGAVAHIPHANQLWMLAGFALFERLGREWNCLEVFPQATSYVLGASGIHKTKIEGLWAQLRAASQFTHWPNTVNPNELRPIAYGSLHDCLDAYLAAWVAALDESEREPLGEPPTDVIWVQRVPKHVKKLCT